MLPETASEPARVPDAAAPLGRDLALLSRGPDTRVFPELLAAYAAAAAPSSLRASRADVLAFDVWCRNRGVKTVPAGPENIAAFLKHRAGEGAAPASLTRYKVSIAKLHKLCRLADPTAEELVKLTLRGIRREKGVAQKQARPIRFRGAVKDPFSDPPRGLNLRGALAALGSSLTDQRDKALLSIAYDTGLRASELVAVQVADIEAAIDPDARLLRIVRSKGDKEGQGATAYLSARSVAALTAWLDAAGIGEGPVLRRVIVRRYAARPVRKRGNPASLASTARWHSERFAPRGAVAARVEEHVGEGALHPGSVTPVIRSALRRAFEAGAFPDLDGETFARQLAEVSAHSMRVGVNQDYFAAGEDLAGIMDALRWKSPRMPLLYNRNLAAEQGAAGRLLGKLA
jgi:integrase